MIHTFKGGSDGAAPTGGLIADAKGHLYTTTQGGGNSNLGTIIQLAPPATGQTTWRENVLHSLSDASHPIASLIADAKGNLYMTTYEGGSALVGTVAEVTP